MKTLKRFGASILRSVLYLIPVSAALALAVWFLGQLVFGLHLGGYLNIWKWCYIVMAVLLILHDLFFGTLELFVLWAFSTRLKVPFNDVETAWWDLGFHEKHSDMFEWDAERFKSEFVEAKDTRGLANALARAFRER